MSRFVVEPGDLHKSTCAWVVAQKPWRDQRRKAAAARNAYQMLDSEWVAFHQLRRMRLRFLPKCDCK